jgi:hypothetical protein
MKGNLMGFTKQAEQSLLNQRFGWYEKQFNDKDKTDSFNFANSKQGFWGSSCSRCGVYD